jgi:hypothetical protein
LNALVRATLDVEAEGQPPMIEKGAIMITSAARLVWAGMGVLAMALATGVPFSGAAAAASAPGFP